MILTAQRCRLPQGIIQKIEIEGLFGRYNHILPNSENMRSPAILYGDNGVGKSTILNLVFHLLSSAGDKGHRTALHKIPFGKVRVLLSNGTELTAKKVEGSNDDEVLLEIFRNGRLYAEWLHTSNSSRHRKYADESIWEYFDSHEDHLTSNAIKAWQRINSQSLSNRKRKNQKTDGVLRGEENYINALTKFAPAVFYLNADRKLESESVDGMSEELELRQILNRNGPKKITDILAASRSILLKQALAAASKWINTSAVRSANVGSENVHSTYESIINQIAVDYSTTNSQFDKKSLEHIRSELTSIENDTRDFAKYELTSPLRMDDFRSAIATGRSTIDGISARIISSYLQSLTERLNALRPTYQILDDYITTINKFLNRKSIEYSLSSGFSIANEFGEPLKESQLSSGEQQLLLIFSFILAARDTPSIFIIDEPEISLNIKWQRNMVESLLRVAEGSEIQFILASHSIELITQHSDSVIPIR